MASNKALVHRYLDYCQVHRGRTRATLYTYRWAFEALCEHLGSTPFAEAGVDDYRRYIRATTKAGKRGAGQAPSPATIRRRTYELRGLIKWLYNEGLIPKDLSGHLEAPEVHNEAPKPIPVETWRDLWMSDLSDSDRVGFGLGLFCGLRRHEATALKPGHFVVVDRNPMIVGFGRKGGKWANMPWLSCVRQFKDGMPQLIGGNVQTFTEPLARLLRDRRNGPYLLDWEPTGRGRTRKYERPEGWIPPLQFNRRLERALKEAGLHVPGDVHQTPHALRHGFCTYLLRMGVELIEVSRLANHSSIDVTKRYLDTAVDPLGDRLGAVEDDVDLDDFGPWAA